ncbi:unnamed protein product [Rotaria magnacalcarata]|uniref:NAD(P)(+)--arginine ADP-ribosyltransferase n=1 Tax=Rotaria magnacalcarata TaxID=392030 RepID=A0A816Z4D6_9BILA|nr:unnamed protein product [Rotaria magnacalcarata]
MAGEYTKSSVDISNPYEETIELSKMINLIAKNENVPLLSLDEAINPLRVVVPELEQMVLIVRSVNNTSPNILKNDESHSILLYTMKWTPIATSFHVILNNILQTRNLTLLKPWLYYIKLLMTALSKLTTNFSHITVYHAVKLNLITQYPEGRVLIWWNFASCTSSLNILNDGNVFGQNGERTLFIIDSKSGKSIRQHSFYPNEEDILLPAACQFQVTDSFDAGHGLHLIHLKEIRSTQKHVIVSPEKHKFKMIDPSQPSSISSPFQNIANAHSSSRLIVRKTIEQSSLSFTMPKHIRQLLKRADPKVKKCIESLYTNPTLVTLELAWNEIGDDEAKAIAYSIQQNKMITTLDLQHNLIGPKGAQHLAKVLQENMTLTTINLENNRIGDQGAEYFANALRLNKRLASLNLRTNQIRSQGIQHLSMALEQNQTLTKLNLRSNQIDNLGASYLANALRKNQTLTVLSLASNRITAKGAQHFANALQINNTLTTLDLQSNEIGPIGGQYLANALQANKMLTILNLKNNQIGIEAKRRITESMQHNFALHIII